jgi:hypothetical protein
MISRFIVIVKWSSNAYVQNNGGIAQ